MLIIFSIHVCLIVPDIAKANVLISDDHTACISDFGLAMIAQDLSIPGIGSGSLPNTSAGHSPVRWTAPELFDFANGKPSITFFSDVYSFGCVALEVKIFSDCCIACA